MKTLRWAPLLLRYARDRLAHIVLAVACPAVYALVCALAGAPLAGVVYAGALDSRATDSLLRLFGEINEDGQTILMVTHSVKAASHAGRVMFIKDGEVFHQLYRGLDGAEGLYQRISDTLTVIATGGARHA